MFPFGCRSGNPKMGCPGKWKGRFNLRSNSWWFHFDPYPFARVPFWVPILNPQHMSIHRNVEQNGISCRGFARSTLAIRTVAVQLTLKPRSFHDQLILSMPPFPCPLKLSASGTPYISLSLFLPATVTAFGAKCLKSNLGFLASGTITFPTDKVVCFILGCSFGGKRGAIWGLSGSPNRMSSIGPSSSSLSCSILSLATTC